MLTGGAFSGGGMFRGRARHFRDISAMLVKLRTRMTAHQPAQR
jgi:hypothetical protein